MYRCVATNVAGSTSRDIQLDVYSTPSIPGGDVIDTHDVNRGRPFSLECNVVGHPRPDIEVSNHFESLCLLSALIALRMGHCAHFLYFTKM